MQRFYEAAMSKLLLNVVPFSRDLSILVEGGGYNHAWIETQPMGGEMFARHDAQVALNNQMVFMLTQREDGRLPGMVISTEAAIRNGHDREPGEGHAWFASHQLAASYEMLQGYCFPEPAWRMYFWAEQDESYLRDLDASLRKHDAYLWRTRDSDGDGVLETWCVWDTGEDGCTRLTRRGVPHRWPFDLPPGSPDTPDYRDAEQAQPYWFRDRPTPMLAPFASMDLMAYSYAGRTTLAKIATRLNNGEAALWQTKAEDVRQRLIERLWDEQRQACFDRDRNGRVLPELIHNNLRCMAFGIFTQAMADGFVREHLLNPREFWTPMPLVSIAADESLFLSKDRNNWSGQPQGLTYQRAIGALENYGYHAVVTRLGRRLISQLIENKLQFTQQFDPQTGKASGSKDGYGPTILASLEYLIRMHGIHLDVEHGEVWWSGLPISDDANYACTQCWGERLFEWNGNGQELRATVNGREVFAITPGARAITDLEGRVLRIVGIDPENQNVMLSVSEQVYEIHLRSNAISIIEP